MSRIIKGIVIDGFHKGHVVHMEYYPTLKLIRPSIVRVDYCCDGQESEPTPMDYDEYKACFTAVDGKTVLYSQKGDSQAAFSGFGWQVSERPWTPKTRLFMGYHDEPIRREELTPSCP